jgi:hypothetical protein
MNFIEFFVAMMLAGFILGSWHGPSNCGIEPRDYGCIEDPLNPVNQRVPGLGRVSVWYDPATGERYLLSSAGGIQHLDKPPEKAPLTENKE